METREPTPLRFNRSNSTLSMRVSGCASSYLRRLIKGRTFPGTDITAPRVMGLFDALADAAEPPSLQALTRQALHAYRTLEPADKLSVLLHVSQNYDADTEALQAAIAAFQNNQATVRIEEIHRASESRRQLLIRRLGSAKGGVAALIEMRGEVLKHLDTQPHLAALDRDLLQMFKFWFNGSLISLRRLESSSPAAVLRQLIEREAVHPMNGWSDLWRRLDPPDRRCYGLFHPSLPDSPLIFVEIALTADLPTRITDILAEKREPIPAEAASMAVFYSISNCQPGLAGIRFGNSLLMQVMDVLKAELPNLKSFVTLSPAPGFARWLREARKQERPVIADIRHELEALDDPHWSSGESHGKLAPALLTAAARYFLWERTSGDHIIDPVARFHLGNGATLQALQFLADPSPNGLQNGCGLMVNYVYDSNSLVRNCLLFSQRRIAVASLLVRKMAGRLPRRHRKTAALRRPGS